MEWRAWYDDGTVYSSTRTAWQHLPDEGMVGVVVYHDPPYRQLVVYGDWYWLEDGRIHRRKTGEWGEWVEPPEVACSSCLKRSGAMTDEAWEAVQAEMMEADAC